MGEVGKYCELRPDGSLATGSAVVTDNGYAVKTDVVGTPDKFSGTQTVAAPPSVPKNIQQMAGLPSTVPASSENLKARGEAHLAALGGQQLLRDCAKKFPSL
jgi:hypothetical protein